MSIGSFFKSFASGLGSPSSSSGDGDASSGAGARAAGPSSPPASGADAQRQAALSQAAYGSPEEARGAATRLGFDDADVFSGPNHTQAVVNYGKNAGVDVAFKGTDPTQPDMVTNDLDRTPVSAGTMPGAVHAGFKEDVDGLNAKGLERDIADRHAQVGGPIQLTGHSLGGAQAYLEGDQLSHDGLQPDKVTTFGAPVVGDEAWATDYDKRLGDATTAFVNKGDPIPDLGVDAPDPSKVATQNTVHLDSGASDPFTAHSLVDGYVPGLSALFGATGGSGSGTGG